MLVQLDLLLEFLDGNIFWIIFIIKRIIFLINHKDPAGESVIVGAINGARIGSGAGLWGAVVGACIGATGGAAALDYIFYSEKVPKDAHEPNGAKVPGKPSQEEGFKDGKSGERWVNSEKGHGWLDEKGSVWVPTGQGSRAHGGHHWDVQKKDGTYNSTYPGGHRR